MSTMKYVFGALALLLLMATTYAATAETLESQVVIQPANDAGTVVDVSVLVFQPLPAQSGSESRLSMEELTAQCQATEPDNVFGCVERKSAELDAEAHNYKANVTSVPGAHVRFEYYTTSGNPVLVDACADVQTNTPAVMYTTSPTTGDSVPVTVYSGRCTIPESVYAGQLETSLVATFDPQGMTIDGKAVQPSDYRWTISTASIQPAAAFTKQLNDMIKQLAEPEAGRATPLPCLGAFLVLGLLLASMYFSGKSPVSLLDITTPRLPSPKGVAAGGQILGPFGYTEMKGMTKAKMAAAASALQVASKGLKGAGGAASKGLVDQLNANKGTAADRAAGDLEQQKTVARSLITAGSSVGMSAEQLKGLAATLPYHYGEAEQRTIAEIIQKLREQGGKSALYAETVQQYLFSQRTFQSLEALTAHPDIGKRSAVHYALTNTVGKAFGANRYSVLGGFVMPGIDSTFRSGRMVGRMGKAIVTEAAPLTRSVAKTTMEMIGGKRAMADLAAAARRGGTAEWAYAQLTKHPSQVVMGQMFPVNDKMGHFYKSLNTEAQRDQMRYLVGQLYKKMGVKFDISEAELVAMGHTDMDILKRAGYRESPELAKLETAIKNILADGSKSGQQKVAELAALAQSQGAHVDQRMFQVMERMSAIEQSSAPDYIKMLNLQQLLNEENKIRSAALAAGRGAEDAYLCHVGGDSLRGAEVWNTMVLRTMVWDAEHGYLQGGLKEELLSARLNVANRTLTLLDLSKPGSLEAAMAQLPEHMRDQSQLKAFAERNRQDLMALFSDEGKAMFQKASGKSISNATTTEMVQFMYGGGVEEFKTHHIDKATGKMVWWGNTEELQLPERATMVDLKRHWLTGLDPRDNFAIGQWVESRFTRSYVPPHRASIEAELDRMAGSAAWTVEQRAKESKKLWVTDTLMRDMEGRFNSQFTMNAYGTTHETSRFYAGVLTGFMDKALRDKGMEQNHPDLMFLQQLDVTNAKHLAKLSQMLTANRQAVEELIRKPVTYDDIAKSNKAIVMLHEGGFAYYNKGMMLSDQDRVLGGEVALRDNKGQMRAFAPEDVPIKFLGRDDLAREFDRVSRSKDPKEWETLVNGVKTWAKGGGYDYDKEKVLAAVLWQYSNTTYDYSRFWKDSAVTVEAKREVTPLAPSVLRYFGSDASGLTTTLKPVRDIGLTFGDYVSKVALASGGPVHKASYDITPVSELERQHSWRLASKIMSGEMKGLTKEEQSAYRAVAISHFGAHQVWDYAIDRNPWRMSTSYGSHQAWGSFFQFGPSQQYSVQDNLRSYMDKGQYANFMATYGFSMDISNKIMRPYTGMVRGMQMSMQGYASKWDQRDDALRQWDHTSPRIREAAQAINPFSFHWFPGKTSDRLASLNAVGGSLEKRQLAGKELAQGLMVAPQDVFLNQKGVYSPARYGEANPGASYYNYRNQLMFDPAMAEYLYRNKEAAYMNDLTVREAAMTNITRRTVAAEALAMRREQELRGFGVMQNPLYGWANPIAFVWHMPVPGFPQSASPKDLVANYVRRAKHGGGGSFADRMRGVTESIGQGATKLAQPSKLTLVVYCPNCGMSGMRGSRCKNASCKASLY